MPYLWSPESGRYRDASTGRFVRDQTIRGALEMVLLAQAASTRDSTQSMVDGTLPIGVWQTQMMLAIKAVHLIGLAVAGGGWAQLDQSDYGWVGQRIRVQYDYLRSFAIDIAAGRQALDASAVRRAQMYIHAARATHREAERRLAQRRDLGQERNVLGAADHCRGCLTETRRGWVGIGELVPVGNRTCLTNCHCHLEFRAGAAA